MQKIVRLIMPVFLLLVIGGCLKDKGFNKQQYGIQVNEEKAAAFPQGNSGPVMGAITAQKYTRCRAGPFDST